MQNALVLGGPYILPGVSGGETLNRPLIVGDSFSNASVRFYKVQLPAPDRTSLVKASRVRRGKGFKPRRAAFRRIDMIWLSNIGLAGIALVWPLNRQIGAIGSSLPRHFADCQPPLPQIPTWEGVLSVPTLPCWVDCP